MWKLFIFLGVKKKGKDWGEHSVPWLVLEGEAGLDKITKKTNVNIRVRCTDIERWIPPCVSHVTLDKLLSLPTPWVIHLKNEYFINCLTEYYKQKRNIQHMACPCEKIINFLTDKCKYFKLLGLKQWKK